MQVRFFWNPVIAGLAFASFCGLAWAVIHGAALAPDLAIRASTHQLATPVLTFLMMKLTYAGSAWVLAALFAGSFAGLRRAGRHGQASRLAWTMAMAVVMENGLKHAFQRARPEPFFGLSAPETYSFPSGHALFSSCFYGMMALILANMVRGIAARSAIRAGTILLIVLIGFSRIYLGMHYPSDVLGGYLAALVCLGLFWREAGRHQQNSGETFGQPSV